MRALKRAATGLAKHPAIIVFWPDWLPGSLWRGHFQPLAAMRVAAPEPELPMVLTGPECRVYLC